jgi:hypothetical protein
VATQDRDSVSAEISSPLTQYASTRCESKYAVKNLFEKLKKHDNERATVHVLRLPSTKEPPRMVRRRLLRSQRPRSLRQRRLPRPRRKKPPGRRVRRPRRSNPQRRQPPRSLLLSRRLQQPARKGGAHQVNDLGYGNNVEGGRTAKKVSAGGSQGSCQGKGQEGCCNFKEAEPCSEAKEEREEGE